MRLIKMFGFAAVAAIASMALLGASSAVAKESTVLCKVNNELPCKNNPYTGHVEALSTKAVLTAGFIKITCEHSLVLGEALGLATAPAPLIIHVSELTFTKCKGGTVVVKDKTGLILALKLKLNEAEGTAEGFEVLAEALGEHCVYGGVGKGAKGFGGEPGTIVANEVGLEEIEGGFFCPGESKWTATYTITLPKPIYISS